MKTVDFSETIAASDLKVGRSRHLITVDSEMFARTEFSLIFANSLPREFKVLANIVLDSY